VIEPRRPEARAQLLREAFVLSQHDPLEDRSSLPLEAGGNRARQPAANPVGVTAQTAAASDRAPLAGHDDDVHAAAPQPPPLVEAARRGAWLPQPPAQLEASALGRRAAERKLEKDRLVRKERAEAQQLRRYPDRERAAAGGAGDLDESRFRFADVRREHARIERVEPATTPPPAGK